MEYQDRIDKFETPNGRILGTARDEIFGFWKVVYADGKNGAEIELMGNDGEWIYIDGSPSFVPEYEYRIKPKWWENIPEHGVLVDFMGLICTVSKDENCDVFDHERA